MARAGHRAQARGSHVPPGVAAWLVLVLLAGGCRSRVDDAHRVMPPRWAPEIVSISDGAPPFRLSTLRGSVVLLSFGATRCTEGCATALARMERVHERLGPVAEGLEVVFVSVDPERDTTERLTRSVHAFHPRFHGVRLEGAVLAAVLDSYGVRIHAHPTAALRLATQEVAPPPPPEDTTVSGGFFLVDRRGMLRLRFPPTATLEQLLAGVELLLREER
jgi:protein SCO1